MARYKGKDGDATAGGTSIGEIESFDISDTIAELDANVMGNNGFTDVEDGLRTVSGTVNVLFDHGDAGQSALTVGSTVTLVLYPAGNTTGLTQIAGDFLVTSRDISSNATEIVKASITVRNKGAVTIGPVV